MRKLKMYIASSLNAKIAQKDGSVDWLESIPKPEEINYGYGEFYESIDTTIQGSSTYKQIISWEIDFPYPTKKNYVITRNKDAKDTNFVSFIKEDHVAFVSDLKKESGKDIWLIGGGQMNTLFLNAGLVDEIIVFIMPIILPGGIDLFQGLPNQQLLSIKKVKTYETGVVEIVYRIKK